MTTPAVEAVYLGDEIYLVHEIYLGDEPLTSHAQVIRYLTDNYTVRASDAADMVANDASVSRCLAMPGGYRKTVAWLGDCIASRNNLQ